MKQKFFFLTAFVVFVQLRSFAQHPESLVPSTLPWIVEDGIFDITVSDNIDVVLIQDEPENVRVKASDNVVKKLKMSLANGKLSLVAAKNLAPGERLAVYVWVNELERLTLKGNAFVTSAGVLRNKVLHISAGKEATVSLKSNGKVWFDTPENYQVVKESGYFSVYAK